MGIALGCFNGFPESPTNTTQFLQAEDQSILTGIQVILPEMKFNCSGAITGWTGWFTVNSKVDLGHYAQLQLWRPRGDQNYDIVGVNFPPITDTPGKVYYNVTRNMKHKNWIYFQPGDVLGFYVPAYTIRFSTPLISNNGGSTLYYYNFDFQPCNLSLCDTRFSRREGIQVQVKPILSKCGIN